MDIGAMVIASDANHANQANAVTAKKLTQTGQPASAFVRKQH